LLALGLAATPAYGDDADARLRAAYPMSPPSGATFAGIDTARFVTALPGLHLKTRDDHTPENGGSTLSFADDQGRVRAVVRIAVARDAVGARGFVMTTLRGVSGVLGASASAGASDEVAFADEAGRGDHFVVGARGNIAYAIDALDGATPASAIRTLLVKAIVSGAPVFPQAKVTLPALDHADPHGAAIGLVAAVSTTHHVHATGAYVTRSRAGEVVHPFAAGPVVVTAIVVDGLARVTETSAAAIAQ
jgi:hypothetical protein